MSKKNSKVQKLDNKHVTAVINSSTGVASYTNYSMHPKANPYLAPPTNNILGYNLAKS